MRKFINIRLVFLVIVSVFFIGCSKNIIEPQMFKSKNKSIIVNGDFLSDEKMLVKKYTNRYNRSWTPTAYLAKNGKIYYEITMSHDSFYNRLYVIYPKFDAIDNINQKEKYKEESKNITFSKTIKFNKDKCIDTLFTLTKSKDRVLIVDCADISNYKNQKFFYLVRKQHFYGSNSGAIEYIDLSTEVSKIISDFNNNDFSFLQDEAAERLAKIFLNREFILHNLRLTKTEKEVYELFEKAGVLELYAKDLRKQFDEKLKKVQKR